MVLRSYTKVSPHLNELPPPPLVRWDLTAPAVLPSSYKQEIKERVNVKVESRLSALGLAGEVLPSHKQALNDLLTLHLGAVGQIKPSLSAWDEKFF